MQPLIEAPLPFLEDVMELMKERRHALNIAIYALRSYAQMAESGLSNGEVEQMLLVS
jgi:hypothetical protein